MVHAPCGRAVKSHTYSYARVPGRAALVRWRESESPPTGASLDVAYFVPVNARVPGCSGVSQPQTTYRIQASYLDGTAWLAPASSDFSRQQVGGKRISHQPFISQRRGLLMSMAVGGSPLPTLARLAFTAPTRAASGFCGLVVASGPRTGVNSALGDACSGHVGP